MVSLPGTANWPAASSGSDNNVYDLWHMAINSRGEFFNADSPDKVEAFYRSALAQYSDVIECRHHTAVGKPERTGLGLTCADDNHVHTGKNHEFDPDSDSETELKAGSKSRQHIVSLQSSASGTRFGLVSLELPRSDDNGA